MKNKVLVAMGIGIGAAMVPAIAAVADEAEVKIDLTEDEIRAGEAVNEAEAGRDINNDGDEADDYDIEVFDTINEVVPGTIRQGNDGNENLVPVAQITYTDNTESFEKEDEVEPVSGQNITPEPSASPGNNLILTEGGNGEPVSDAGVTPDIVPGTPKVINADAGIIDEEEDLNDLNLPAVTSYRDKAKEALDAVPEGFTLVDKDGNPIEDIDGDGDIDIDDIAKKTGEVHIKADVKSDELLASFKNYLYGQG